MPNEVPAQSARQDVITDRGSFLDAFMHVNRLLLGFKNLVVKNRIRKLPDDLRLTAKPSRGSICVIIFLQPFVLVESSAFDKHDQNREVV